MLGPRVGDAGDRNPVVLVVVAEEAQLAVVKSHGAAEKGVVEVEHGFVLRGSEDYVREFVGADYFGVRVAVEVCAGRIRCGRHLG